MIGCDNGHVVAIKAPLLHVEYKVATGAAVNTYPVVTANGPVFVASGTKFQALSPADGGLLWDFDAPAGNWEGRNYASCAVNEAAGVVYVLSHHLYALNMSTGAVLWQSQDNGFANTTPELNPSRTRVYVGTPDGRVAALATGTGATVWVFDAGTGQQATSVVVGTGNRLLFTSQNSVICLESDGSQAWRQTITYPGGVKLFDTVTLDSSGTTACLGTESGDPVFLLTGSIYCYTVATGAVLWSKTLTIQSGGHATLIRAALAFSNDDSTVHVRRGLWGGGIGGKVKKG